MWNTTHGPCWRFTRVHQLCPDQTRTLDNFFSPPAAPSLSASPGVAVQAGVAGSALPPSAGNARFPPSGDATAATAGANPFGMGAVEPGLLPAYKQAYPRTKLCGSGADTVDINDKILRHMGTIRNTDSVVEWRATWCLFDPAVPRQCSLSVDDVTTLITFMCYTSACNCLATSRFAPYQMI